MTYSERDGNAQFVAEHAQLKSMENSSLRKDNKLSNSILG